MQLIVNTNSKNLELYSVMAEHDGSGFPLSYCVLSTASSVTISKRTQALTEWATCLRDIYGVKPDFAHVDKDMAEISMIRDVWDPKIQLCWWHTKSAVEDRIQKSKLSTTPYNAQRARSKFPFISLNFVPSGKADPREHEGGTGGTRDHTGFADTPNRESPNAITLHIPIPSNLHERPTTSTILPLTNNTIQPIPLQPIPLQGTATLSSGVEKLKIRLPATLGKENHKPSAPSNTDSPSLTCWNVTFVPIR